MDFTTITIQIPSDLLQQAREIEKESLDALVTEALSKEIKLRRAWEAHKTIIKIREEVKQKTGVHPSPIPLIHQLREGEGRRD